MEVDDTKDQDILKFIPRCNEIIHKALLNKENVLVHWFVYCS